METCLSIKSELINDKSECQYPLCIRFAGAVASLNDNRESCKFKKLNLTLEIHQTNKLSKKKSNNEVITQA